MKALLLVSLLAGALLAGCSSDTPAASVMPDAPLPPGFYAGAALYEDPQNTPHPAYNWSTVSHPTSHPLAPSWWRASNGTVVPATLTDLQHVVQTDGVGAGAGIALFGSLAVVPSFGDGPSSIVDISEPTAPRLLSTFESKIASHRGATIIAYPTGRLVTVISTDNGLDVWDISNPLEPVALTPIDDIPSHKVGVVPGTPIVYNARSDGGNGGLLPGAGNLDPENGQGIIDIYDFSDPDNPVEVQKFANGYGCHHIYFWNNVTEGKFRGLCAGIEYTQIFDTTDPKDPKVIVSVPYGHGRTDLPSGSASIAAFSHYAGLSLDGKMLLVGDEHGGGIGPIGCFARVDTPSGAVSTPVGAVWFYDISDETNPVYKGHVSASQIERALGGSLGSSCTAHHGRLLPTQGRDLLAMSFYGAGVVLVDFTGVRGEGAGLPEVVAQWADGSNTWETWFYNGYLYTGDLSRGMDVLKLV